MPVSFPPFLTTLWSQRVLWLLTVLVALASARYLMLPIQMAGDFMAHHAANRPLALYGHITGATIALALLPIQFSPRLRRTRLGLHRWLGRLYGASIAVGSLSGLALAVTTEAGPFAAMGFAALAVLWAAFTARAIWLAIQGEIAAHRAWMVRSAALTLAAVSLRLELPLLQAIFGFEIGYPLVAWLCWVPNLLIAEWLLSTGHTSQSLQTSPA